MAPTERFGAFSFGTHFSLNTFMLSFLQFLTESPVIAGDYSLESKFDHFNRTLFEGRIPPCPLNWAYINHAGGITYYTSFGRTIIPGTLRIEINTKFKRTEQNLDALLIHEMIHAFLAVTSGDGDGKHGWRFQSMAHKLSAQVGYQIPLKDDVGDLEVTNDEKPLTTVVMYKDRKQRCWFANYYSATAFDSPAKMDELAAFWGQPDKLKDEEEMLVIKLHTNLGTKYGMSRSVTNKKWWRVSPAEEEDIMAHGQIMRRILPGSVSKEDAINQMPSKLTLVVLQTNKLRNTTYATFYVPSIAQDPLKMAKLIEKWKGYHEPGVRDIEIFTTNSTIFSRGIKMTRDETSGMYYNLKPDSIAELRRNAKYIQRWI